MATFDEVRGKMEFEMTDADKAVVVENQDKWNDEEKQVFSQYIPQQETPIEPAAPVTPAPQPQTPEAPKTPVAQFQTEEELANFIKKVNSDIRPQTPPAPPKSPEAPKEPPKIITDDYIPSNAREHADKLYDEFKARLDADSAARAKEEADRVAENQRREDELAKTYESQYMELVSTQKVPDPKTDEGKKVLEQVANVMRTYEMKDFRKAHEVWAHLPEDRGGGYKAPAPSAPQPAAPQNDINAQKQAAAKVGGGTTASRPTINNTYNWEKDHHKSLDQLIKEFGQ